MQKLSFPFSKHKAKHKGFLLSSIMSSLLSENYIHLQIMPDIRLLPDTSLLNNIIYNTLKQKMHQLR